MKKSKILFLVLTLCYSSFFTSCSSDDDGNGDTNDGDNMAIINDDCISNDLELLETEIRGETGLIFIDFDVTNNSAEDYSLSDPIVYTLTITTTDGSMLESSSTIPISSLSSGATTNITVSDDIGDRTFSSFEISLSCLAINSTGSTPSCLSDDFELEQTQVSGTTGSISIDFDVTNNSSEDFNISSTSSAIRYTLVFTTTDGAMIESSALLLISALSSGATATTTIGGDIGNRTFSSFEITLSCL